MKRGNGPPNSHYHAAAAAPPFGVRGAGISVHAPRPIQTPSLKKENGGQDITVPLVKGKIGWAASSSSSERATQAASRAPQDQQPAPAKLSSRSNIPHRKEGSWAERPPVSSASFPLHPSEHERYDLQYSGGSGGGAHQTSHSRASRWGNVHLGDDAAPHNSRYTSTTTTQGGVSSFSQYEHSSHRTGRYESSPLRGGDHHSHEQQSNHNSSHDDHHRHHPREYDNHSTRTFASQDVRYHSQDARHNQQQDDQHRGYDRHRHEYDSNNDNRNVPASSIRTNPPLSTTGLSTSSPIRQYQPPGKSEEDIILQSIRQREAAEARAKIRKTQEEAVIQQHDIAEKSANTYEDTSIKQTDEEVSGHHVRWGDDDDDDDETDIVDDSVPSKTTDWHLTHPAERQSIQPSSIHRKPAHQDIGHTGQFQGRDPAMFRPTVLTAPKSPPLAKQEPRKFQGRDPAMFRPTILTAPQVPPLTKEERRTCQGRDPAIFRPTALTAPQVSPLAKEEPAVVLKNKEHIVTEEIVDKEVINRRHQALAQEQQQNVLRQVAAKRVDRHSMKTMKTETTSKQSHGGPKDSSRGAISRPISPENEQTKVARRTYSRARGPRTKGVLFQKLSDGSLECIKKRSQAKDITNKGAGEQTHPFSFEAKTKEALKEKAALPVATENKDAEPKPPIAAPVPTVSAWKGGPPTSMVSKDVGDYYVSGGPENELGEQEGTSMGSSNKARALEIRAPAYANEGWVSSMAEQNENLAAKYSGVAPIMGSWESFVGRAPGLGEEDWTEPHPNQPHHEDGQGCFPDPNAVVPHDLFSSAPCSEDEAKQERVGSGNSKKKSSNKPRKKVPQTKIDEKTRKKVPQTKKDEKKQSQGRTKQVPNNSAKNKKKPGESSRSKQSALTLNSKAGKKQLVQPQNEQATIVKPGSSSIETNRPQKPASKKYPLRTKERKPVRTQDLATDGSEPTNVGGKPRSSRGEKPRAKKGSSLRNPNSSKPRKQKAADNRVSKADIK